MGVGERVSPLLGCQKCGLKPAAGGGPDTISTEERQAWIIAQLEKGMKLRRRNHENHFGDSIATTKRDLGALASSGRGRMATTP